MVNRYDAKTDENHTEIMSTFRDLGCSVFDLSAQGSGLPDLLIGVIGFNLLVEVKTEKTKLNKVQENFFDIWRGQKTVIRTTDEAIELIRRIRGGHQGITRR